LQPEFLEKITKSQQEILKNYSKMVREGGKLIYVTCSILPQENSEQLKQFLASEEGRVFSLEKEVNIYASESGFDGFYMARMIRK
jgi:16S rRNA (cytosine967-C5)-methyltransferase